MPSECRRCEKDSSSTVRTPMDATGRCGLLTCSQAVLNGNALTFPLVWQLLELSPVEQANQTEKIEWTQTNDSVISN